MVVLIYISLITFYHMPIGHLCVFFGVVFVLFLCPFFDFFFFEFFVDL